MKRYIAYNIANFKYGIYDIKKEKPFVEFLNCENIEVIISKIVKELNNIENGTKKRRTKRA